MEDKKDVIINVELETYSPKQVFEIDVIAQGEKGEPGKGAELTPEQLKGLEAALADVGPIPVDEVERMF